MPKPLTTEQIHQLKDLVQNGDVQTVIEVYKGLQAQGYEYAGWARGVAATDSITGMAAMDYLSATAMMGVNGNDGVTLTPAQADKIRKDMSIAYLDALEAIALDNRGVVERDVNFQETRDFHKDVFEENGLAIQNWTLEEPMALLKELAGEAEVEARWARIRETGGDGIDALAASTGLANLMGRTLYNPNPDLAQRAAAWLEKNPGMGNLSQMGGSINLVLRALGLLGKEHVAPAANNDKFGGGLPLPNDADLESVRRQREERAKVFDILRRKLGDNLLRVDPLVLDLDSDGVETVSLDNGVYFDHDGDGLRERTGWISADDGFLALDLNGNGRVDAGNELFGNYSPLDAFGTTAPHGFAALAYRDDNGDGRIDASDAVFSQLRVWRDLNSDGISTGDELKSLAEVGVQSISTAFETSNKTDGLGNERRQIGAFVKTDGTVHQVHDVWFQRDQTWVKDEVVYPGALGLPNVQALGRLPSLYSAMATDKHLRELVSQYVDSTNPAQRRQLVGAILIRWADPQGQFADAPTTPYDDAKLRVIFEGLGLERVRFAPQDGDGSQIVNDVFASLAGLVDEELNQWLSANDAAGLKLDVVSTAEGGFKVVLQGYEALSETQPLQALTGLANLLRHRPEALALGWDGIAFLRQEVQRLANTPGLAETLAAIGVQLGGGAVSQLGYDMGVIRFGTAGEDVLNGTTSGDIFSGGAGNDSIDAGSNDFVEFGVGDGNDTITRRGDGTFSVQLGAGITPDSVTICRGASNGMGTYDLIVTLGSGETLTIKDWIANGVPSMGSLHFRDATVWYAAEITQRLNEATSGNDEFIGSPRGDVLMGGAGNDSMIGLSGHDTLIGGNGNDSLEGGEGGNVLVGGHGDDNLRSNRAFTSASIGGQGKDVISSNASKDTYYFRRGDGQDMLDDFSGPDQRPDTLIFGPGIAASDLRFSRDGMNLLVQIAGTDDQVAIYGWYSQREYQIERMVLDDGTILTPAHVDARRQFGTPGNDDALGTAGGDLMEGGAGNDALTGLDGDDTLDGGSGDDQLVGDKGSDRYVFSGDFGKDTINDGTYRYGAVNSAGDVETIVLDQPSTAVTVLQGGYQNQSLLIQVTGTENQIELLGWLAQDNFNTIRVQFSDGVTWSPQELRARMQPALTRPTEFIVGTTGSDALNGDATANTLHGGFGDDTLDGGAGDDVLIGGSGNDTYLFGIGSGRDRIRDDGEESIDRVGIDTVKMGPGVRPEDVTRTDSADGTTLALTNGLDILTINRSVYARRIERAVFEDGTVWDLTQALPGRTSMSTLNETVHGSEGNDRIDGGGGDDVLLGGAGNDSILAGYGRTVLDGGVGNDRLDGAEGSVYVFDRGYGLDTVYTHKGNGAVRFGAGILPSELVPTMVEYGQLEFALSGSQDRLQIADWLDPSGATTYVNRFEFSDGTVWTAEDVWDRMQAPDIGSSWAPRVQYARPSGSSLTGWAGADRMYGSPGGDMLNGAAGDDSLMGGGGNDTILGGSGNDTLSGGAGNDRFIFQSGFGHDVIDESFADTTGEDNRVVFGPGIGPQDVVVTGDDPFSTSGIRQLYLSVIGTGDKLTIKRWFEPGRTPIQAVEFADGTVWRREDLLEKFYNLERGGDMFGSDAADRLIGDGSADRLDAGAGNDTLRGMAGNDLLDGDLGDDLLDGGDGDDLLVGGLGDDTYVFERGYGRDTVTDFDRVNGSHDRILLGTGILPTLLRVSRDDTHIVLTVPDTGDELRILWYPDPALRIEELRFADGTVWSPDELEARALASLGIDGTAGADRLTGRSSADVLRGLGGDDWLLGMGGDDTLEGGAGSDTLDGGNGADQLIGGDGNDVYLINDLGDVTVETVSGGHDRVESAVSATLSANVEDLVLVGQAATNAIGNAIENVLRGNAGHNILSGGLGADVYAFARGWGDDQIDELGHQFGLDLADDGAVDEIRFEAGISSDDLEIVFDGSSGGGGMAIFLKGTSDRLEVTGFLENYGTVERLRFADGTVLDRDALMQRGRTRIGTDADDVFFGPSIGATLEGRGGNDRLHGHIGDDTLRGEAGDDTLVANEGSDQLFGGDGSDQLDGGDGNDLLDGGAESDLMVGGFGDDTFIVDHAEDSVAEYQVDGGVDTVQASVTWTLGSNVERLRLTGAAAIDGTGNGLANTIIGNAAANTLNGGTGNDTLDGGFGADAMIGGAGNDMFFVDNSGDVVTEGTSGGTDLVKSSVSWTLGANVENLELTGSAAIDGTGNSAHNRITGNGAANVLTGGAGNDTMTGGAGNDTYVVDVASDVVVESANEGVDLVQSAVVWTLGANFENLTLTGTGSINGTGNVLNNVLAGNGGNNRLDGSTGADTMSGGAGNDTYVVDNALDITIEAANGGSDTVESLVTWTLSAETENLTLMGTSAIGGTGNALANIVRGNAAANALAGRDGNDSLVGGAGDDTLDGGAGVDTLVGGAGNDTYIVDIATDGITENANEGTDTVVTAVMLTLAANLENVTLSGTSGIGATGNTANNVMTGNAGANALSGAAGNDTLNGAGGNDTLTGGAGADGYVFGRGYGSDTIVENDATTGVKDFVSFGANIARSDITFQKSGNALLARVNGTSDMITLQDWYLGAMYHVEEFRFSDGSVLTDTQAQALVSAMSTFTASGTTSSIASTSDTSQRLPSMAVNEPNRHTAF